jgi:hypothetical protein
MSDKNISMIVYQKNDRPKYYELNKRQLRFMLTALPIITVLCVLALSAGVIYFKQIRLAAQKREPVIIQELRSQLSELKEESQETFKLNKRLESKLAQTEVGEASVSPLTLFKLTPGQQDLSNSPIISVEDFEVLLQGPKDVKLKFNLINLEDDGTRQSGYIFILMMTGNTYTFYPKDALIPGETRLTFNKGEYFSAARFRPVEAELNLPENKGPALFKVLIFSRLGDLLTKKIHSFDLGS